MSTDTRELLVHALDGLKRRLKVTRPSGHHPVSSEVIAEAEWILGGCVGPNPDKRPFHHNLRSPSLDYALYSVLDELSWIFPGDYGPADKLAAEHLGWDLKDFQQHACRTREQKRGAK